jgi:hypothetical protein
VSLTATALEVLTAAAGELQSMGAAIDAQNSAAAATATGVISTAAEEVSTVTATQFVIHAQMYQTVSTQAVAIHELFTTTLRTTTGSYAGTAAANAIATSGLAARG